MRSYSLHIYYTCICIYYIYISIFMWVWHMFFFVCCFSIFILSNETVNIWSHLLGFLLFFSLGVNDLSTVLPASGANREDYVIYAIGLFCFQVKQVLQGEHWESDDRQNFCRDLNSHGSITSWNVNTPTAVSATLLLFYCRFWEFFIVFNSVCELYITYN